MQVEARVFLKPVRARAEGWALVGINAETAALFSGGFEVMDERMVPKWWRIGSLGELLILLRGSELPYDHRVHEPYQIASASGPSEYHAEYKVEGPGVTIGRSGLLGKVFFIYENFWPLNMSLWVKNFRVSQPYNAYFLLETLRTETYNSGSVVLTLNRNHIHRLHVIVPIKYIIDLFEKLATPIFSKIRKDQNKSNTLTATRDSLLPGFLSGKLRIKGLCIYNW
jgi:type I restriction enzyme S subunit